VSEYRYLNYSGEVLYRTHRFHAAMIDLRIEDDTAENKRDVPRDQRTAEAMWVELDDQGKDSIPPRARGIVEDEVDELVAEYWREIDRLNGVTEE
jgi:hypothetical protein